MACKVDTLLLLHAMSNSEISVLVFPQARLECLTDAANNSSQQMRVNGKWRIKLRKEQVGAFYAELLSIKCSFTIDKLQLDPLS